MDKSSQSSGSGESSSTTTLSSSSSSSSRDQNYLKQLNKLSHKISKPNIIIPSSTAVKKHPFDPTLHHNNPLQPQPQQSQSQSQSQSQHLTHPLQPQQQPNNNNINNLQQQQQQQHQPPVYNIHKNDFRDVVQKLTGSPAHDRFSAPPPIHPPRPANSRLQRIRPPPLAHVSNRPPPLLNSSAFPPPQQPPTVNPAANGFIPRPPPQPLSPLPPFPAVHAAAESPVSAYMRYFQSSVSMYDPNKMFPGFSQLAPLASPRWNNPQPQQNQQELAPQQQGIISSPTSGGMIASQPQFHLPTSPTLPPFGCMNSPRSPYALLSPSLLLSPSSFPLSPTVPLPSPKWRGI